MPRKRKELNYKEQDDEEESSDWDDKEESKAEADDDEESVEAETPPKKRTKKSSSKPKRPPAKKPAPAKKSTSTHTDGAPAEGASAKKPSTVKKGQIDDDPITSSEEEGDHLSSIARRTSRGGYAHTNKSRLKISKANKGNVPWNKGKHRSESAKAKIAAGVRARNREVLLAKLEKLGMTEDQYHKKMREIKFLRERVRRAKKANAMRDAEITAAADKKAGKRSEVTTGYEYASDDEKPKDPDEEEEEEEEEDSYGEVEESEKEEEEDETERIHPMLSMFAPDIHWTTHPFTAQKEEEAKSYDEICPSGGPGGLICCSVCAATYSKYMSATFQDLEEQRTSKVAEELKHLLGFMKDAKAQLAQSVRAARKKNPPLNTKRAGVVVDGRVSSLRSLKNKPAVRTATKESNGRSSLYKPIRQPGNKNKSV